MNEGTVIKIVVERGFGFISRPGEPRDLFFHATQLRELEFNEQLIERRVVFGIAHGPKGERAVDIYPID